MNQRVNRKISVAPMMDWTDRHDRYFLRTISQEVLLYTEMVTTGAILKGDAERHLRFDSSEHPIAVQLGGSEPQDLADAAKICEDFGYDEINLNVGCPSDRVQSGKFGACLMAEPELVAECVSSMRNVVKIPVTVKHRIGIDHLDSYEFLTNFVTKVASAGCQSFTVHARKALLNGLSPKENREIPPLNYPRVYQLKSDFPELEIIINGGITTLEQAELHLQHVDGVMIGREAYHNPYVLSQVDQRFYNSVNPVKTRRQIIDEFLPYVEEELSKGTRLQHISRHILGLFHGQTGGRLWRRHLSENAHKANAGINVLLEALNWVE